MATYYNPYNTAMNYGVNGYPNYQMYGQPAQSYTAFQPQTGSVPGIIWVDGEVGAKAFQMPSGVTGPIALWDMNAPVIYLKSINQMGMPNPLQKLNYQMESTAQQNLPVWQNGNGGNSGNSGSNGGGGNSGNSGNSEKVETLPAPDAQYATKDELASMHNELRAIREALENQGSNENQNNGNTQNSNMIGNRGGKR